SAALPLGPTAARPLPTGRAKTATAFHRLSSGNADLARSSRAGRPARVIAGIEPIESVGDFRLVYRQGPGAARAEGQGGDRCLAGQNARHGRTYADRVGCTARAGERQQQAVHPAVAGGVLPRSAVFEVELRVEM